LLAHGLFCAICLMLIHQRATRQHAPPIWVEVAPPVNKTDPKTKADSQKRVVQSNAGREVKVAEDNAYLGEKNRVVDRETVNAKKAIEAARSGKPRVAAVKNDKVKQAQESKTEIAKFGLAILPEARRKGATEELAKDTPQWANIGSQAQDYVQGIKESDRTALNTREYLYFGYHQRIRQRLELEWTRLLKAELVRFYRAGRRLAEDTEYSTRLMVVLNDRGEITRIKVLDMSGTQELDNVAVQAFNKAGPFPNPPKGLVRNGEIEVPWELKLRS
jgi:protein TonB